MNRVMHTGTHALGLIRVWGPFDLRYGISRPVSNSRPWSQTETTSTMSGPMTTIGTITPSGDKEALYHKLIYTTTTAWVILCKC